MGDGVENKLQNVDEIGEWAAEFIHVMKTFNSYYTSYNLWFYY